MHIKLINVSTTQAYHLNMKITDLIFSVYHWSNNLNFFSKFLIMLTKSEKVCGFVCKIIGYRKIQYLKISGAPLEIKNYNPTW
jgi:hypothetical protein